MLWFDWKVLGCATVACGGRKRGNSRCGVGVEGFSRVLLAMVAGGTETLLGYATGCWPVMMVLCFAVLCCAVLRLLGRHHPILRENTMSGAQACT